MTGLCIVSMWMQCEWLGNITWEYGLRERNNFDSRQKTGGGGSTFEDNAEQDRKSYSFCNLRVSLAIHSTRDMYQSGTCNSQNHNSVTYFACKRNYLSLQTAMHFWSMQNIITTITKYLKTLGAYCLVTIANSCIPVQHRSLNRRGQLLHCSLQFWVNYSSMFSSDKWHDYASARDIFTSTRKLKNLRLQPEA